MKNTYETPLASRYASGAMLSLFSPDTKFTIWRRLWVALAKAEKKLGLPISDTQIAQMESNLTNIDYDRAAYWEKELRHDVMAHIHAWGEQCPAAMPIIHLGATSCYVGDNTDLILMRDGLRLIRDGVIRVLRALAAFAEEYKALPTLGYTHFQPAQPVTVGKRATLWMQELLLDLNELEHRIDGIKLLGSKGTTGTQASFLELFKGDDEKVEALDRLIAEEMGFDGVYPVSGQTYSRKIDAFVLSSLSGTAQSAHKFASDIRLLSHLKELEEPFESAQVGSSAMPYKRNPMRCERMCSLARLVTGYEQYAAQTASTQWFERTLDDSAGKRVAVPEAFLATDAVLGIWHNVASGMQVYPKVIEKHLLDELPFMATENIMMDAVNRGGNRQELHERIRVHSVAAGRVVKEEGRPNDLLRRIAEDRLFGLSEADLASHLDPKLYTGRCSRQVDMFLSDCVKPLLTRYSDVPASTDAPRV